MVAVSILGYVVTAAITIILTSGIWLAIGVPERKNYYTTNIYEENLKNTSISLGNCEELPNTKICENTCEFVICESIPMGLSFDTKYPIFNKTTNCWMRLMSESRSDIILGSYYWDLLAADTDHNYTKDNTNTSGDGQQIYEALLKTAQRGVNIKIAQNYQKGGYVETSNLAALSNGNIQIRSLDFSKWYPQGILHTKSWVVDGKHFYLGSANFDWRSLTQVKELGIAAFNCSCLATDLAKILEIYWNMGAPGAQMPKTWPTSFSTTANHQSPISVPNQKGNQAVYFSASPPGFQSCGREADIDAMIKTIDEANEFLDLAVMDYAPHTLYMKDNNFWYGVLDEAIRRAAFDRKVKVRFLCSRWAHTYPEFYSYLHSLQDLSSELPCLKKRGTCYKKGSIDIRMIEVPPMQYGSIPYARVFHNKYFLTESTAYIGTSNWTPDYWKFTAGIGLIIRSDDMTQSSFLVNQLQQIFNRDWESNYVKSILEFDNSGNLVNKTKEDLR